MNEHFCTCPDTSCDKHPSQHDKGCDLCVKENLETGELPNCVLISAGVDIAVETDFTYEAFADYFLKKRVDKGGAL